MVSNEIYNRPENNPDDDSNYSGTTIYKQDVELTENDIKKLPFDFSFKRQLSGGKRGIWTLGALRPTSFRDLHIRPLWHLSKFYCKCILNLFEQKIKRFVNLLKFWIWKMFGDMWKNIVAMNEAKFCFLFVVLQKMLVFYTKMA